MVVEPNKEVSSVALGRRINSSYILTFIMQNNLTTDPELTSSQIAGEELLVFVGYSEDARDEANAIKELEGKLQSEIHYLRTMGPMPFVNVKIWTWKDDAKPIVGGQSAVVDDALLRSKIAVFVFKERVGTTTKSEIARIRMIPRPSALFLHSFQETLPEKSM